YAAHRQQFPPCLSGFAHPSRHPHRATRIMKAWRSSFADKYLLGAVLLLALVFGGNAAPGFWIDHVIQLAMILVPGVVIWRNPGRKVDPRLLAMIVAIACAVAFQLVPLPAAIIDALQGVVDRA